MNLAGGMVLKGRVSLTPAKND